MTVVNNSAPRTHPNDKLRYIPKSEISRDHTRTGSHRSRCLGGVAEVRPCETGCVGTTNMAASRKMRLRSGFNFRSPAGWDALSSVYEISMIYAHGATKSRTDI